MITQNEIGKIFYFKNSPNHKKRIIEMTSDSVFTVEMSNGTKCIPRENNLRFIQEEDSQGEIIWVDEIEPELFKEPTPGQKALTKKRWESIGKRWRDDQTRPLFFNRHTRSLLINEIAEELEISKGQTRYLLTRFWREGMTRDSLEPKKKGSQNTRTLQGRKAKNGRGLIITPDVEVLFEKAYKHYHLKQGKSLEKTFSNLLRDNYCIKKEDNGIITYEYIDQEKTPTINQFRYWVKNHRDREKELRSLYGDREFENSYSIITGSTLNEVNGAGARAEIDATHLPIEIVSETDRSVCLGHPLLELLVDVYSKMVMGFHLTLANESYETAALAILNSMSDKESFAKEFGVTITPEDWPAHHLPQIILSDNGPFNSRYTQSLEEEYGCYIENAAPRKGSAKSNVERKNESFEDYVRDRLPGSPKIVEKGRGAADPADEACLTLSELTGLIIQKIVEFNHTPIKDYPLTPKQIEEGVAATPLDLWNYSVREGKDHLIYDGNLEKARIILLPRLNGGRVIRKEGIRAFNFIYTSKDPITMNWMVNHMNERIEDVAYNPQKLDCIYLMVNNRIITLELNEVYKPYGDMSLKEAGYYQKKRRLRLNSQDETARLKKLETIDLEEKTIRKAKSESLGLKKKKDKKGNRRKEMESQRQKKTSPLKPVEESGWSKQIEQKQRHRSERFQNRVKEVISKKK